MKKNWEAPSIESLDVRETAYNVFGFYKDGGYIGDGQISGHLTFDKPNENEGS